MWTVPTGDVIDMSDRVADNHDARSPGPVRSPATAAVRGRCRPGSIAASTAIGDGCAGDRRRRAATAVAADVGAGAARPGGSPAANVDREDSAGCDVVWHDERVGDVLLRYRDPRVRRRGRRRSHRDAG